MNIRKKSVRFILIVLCFITVINMNAVKGYCANTLAGFEKVAEDDTLELYIDRKTCDIGIINKKDNTVWLSRPADIDQIKAPNAKKFEMQSHLVVTYADPLDKVTSLVNSTIGSVRREGAVFEEIPNGIRIIYDFNREKEGFKIPVEFEIKDGSLYGRVLLSRIEEYSGNAFITSIAFMPYFGSPMPGEQGYILVPDGSGALIDFNSGRNTVRPYDQDLYGRDSSLSKVFVTNSTENAMLPVFGVKKDNAAMIAIITKGDGLAKISATQAGAEGGAAGVGTSFVYRGYDRAVLADHLWSSKDVSLLGKRPTNTEAYEIQYNFLDQSKANYVGMAEKYREYLMDIWGMKRLDTENNPFIMEVIGAAKKKISFLGMVYNRSLPMTTFSQALRMYNDFSNAGIEDIKIRYVGWTKDANETTIPTSPKVEWKLGGKKGFTKLINQVNASGGSIFADVEIANVIKGKLGWAPFYYASKSVGLSPAMQYAYRRSTFFKNERIKPWYLLSPKYYNRVVSTFLKKTDRYENISYSAASIGRMIYSDFDLKNPYYMDKTAIALGEAGRLLADASSDGLMTDGGNGYMIPQSKYMVNVSGGASGFDIEKESVPFFQIAVHGLVNYSYSPLNLAEDYKKEVLNTVATGAAPYYVFTYDDPSKLKDSRMEHLYGASYNNWKQEAERVAIEYNEVYRGLADKFIVGYEKTPDGLSITEFENGSRIVVNSGLNTASYDGKVIEPYSFLRID